MEIIFVIIENFIPASLALTMQEGSLLVELYFQWTVLSLCRLKPQVLDRVRAKEEVLKTLPRPQSRVREVR